MSKRFYWLKLKNDFFDSMRIKKLRTIAGGDTFTIIYLKLLLYAVDKNGVIEYQGIEPTLSEELALAISEDYENVGLCLSYLKSVGLAEFGQNELLLPEAVANVGSEVDSAERVRALRQRQKTVPALHCNSDVTKCNTEIDIDIDKDIEIEKDIEKNKYGQNRVIDPDILAQSETWFNEFWSLYPRKVKKQDAYKAFLKICKDEGTFRLIMDGLRKQLPTWKDPQYIPHPTTWLNGKRWEDEPQQKKGDWTFSDIIRNRQSNGSSAY